MTDSNADMPVTILPGDEYGFTELEMPAPVGFVVHQVGGLSQQNSGGEFWAWCKVTADAPGYTEIVFTLTDGSTIADPYPRPTKDSLPDPVRLGPVVFKVFC